MQDLGGVDTGLIQLTQQEVRVIVFAHGTQHAHLCAETRRRGRLIGALAARQDLEAAAADRLTRCRQVLRRNRVISVHGADDNDGASCAFQ